MLWNESETAQIFISTTHWRNFVDLFTNIKMVEHGNEKDILGCTYEYCLQMFAEQEGERGCEFFTPACVVRTLVEVLQPYKGRV